MENLKVFAEDLGLDTTVFNQCMDSSKYSNLVREQTDIARQMGVRSTPTFLINGQPVIGAQPIEIFEQVIENLLQE